MRTGPWVARLFIVLVLCSTACPSMVIDDDDDRSGSSSSSSSSGAVSSSSTPSSGASTAASSSRAPSSASAALSSSSSAPASSAAASASSSALASSSGSGVAPSSTGGASSGSGGAGSAGSTGSPSGSSAAGLSSSSAVDVCASLSDGPFTPSVFDASLGGSEDLALDGLGHLAAKDGTEVVLLDGAGVRSVLAMGVGQAYGLRFAQGGDLLVALPGAGTIKRVTPAGVVTNFAVGLAGPNGLYPDHDGNVWVTEFSGSRVVRFGPTGGTPTTVVAGAEAQAANGVVFDPARRALFFTNYSSGRVARVSVATDGTVGPVQAVATLDANPDGLVMDACGHLYVVDQGNSRLFRIRLDAGGAAVGTPVVLADFPTNVANAQFGRGTGFSSTALYVAGNPGTVYRLEVGVHGATVP